MSLNRSCYLLNDEELDSWIINEPVDDVDEPTRLEGCCIENVATVIYQLIVVRYCNIYYYFE